MDQEEVKNAIIESVKFSTDHGVLSMWVTLNYGGTGQGFGGWSLFSPRSRKNERCGNFGGLFVWRVMEIAGVDDVSKMVGKAVRARATDTHVSAIGHIIKDDWFCPTAEFARLGVSTSDGGEA